jgi:hypothetical protein
MLKLIFAFVISKTTHAKAEVLTVLIAYIVVLLLKIQIIKIPISTV